MERGDVISDIVATLRVRSDLYFRAELSAAAAVRVPPERRRIRFHLVLDGACTVAVEGGAPTVLGAGDVALVPDGAAQVIATGSPAAAEPLEALIGQGALRNGVLTAGSAAEPGAVLLCGYAEVDAALSHPALDALPAMMTLRPFELAAEPWLAATLRLMQIEAQLAGPGMAAIMARLIEIVVVQALRRLLLAGEAQSGFVAALSDPRLARALQAMHAAPEKPWRAGDLAALAAMSRAVFVARFGARVGMAPIEYLTRWRLIKARRLLTDTGIAIEEVAQRCGYRSLPSFSRRFKQAFGIGPGAFRRKAGARS